MKIGTLTVISKPVRREFGLTKKGYRYVVSCQCECGYIDDYVESYLVKPMSHIKCKVCF